MAEDVHNDASDDRESPLIAAAESEAAELNGWRTIHKPAPDAVPGYELIDEIGRGGMGVVYRARQLSTKRIIALKVMLAGPFASRSSRKRFQREVELTARSQHPGIVRILESGETSTGQPYYAMDFVDGLRLDKWLAVTQPDTHTTLRLFVQLFEATEYAHAQAVVHRDLKPGNVLVDAEGRSHILDFGLSKALDQGDTEDTLTVVMSIPGQVMGTLGYVSPEQITGLPGDIDARTDVYTLGVMLFEALTGSLPFRSNVNPSDVMRRIQEEPPPLPSSLSEYVDRDLETIILKALEKERPRRYQSVKELGEDIERYLRNEPILAHPPSSLYRFRKKLRKFRGRIFAVAGVMLLISAVFATQALWRNRLEARKLVLNRHATLQSWYYFDLGDVRAAIDRSVGLADLSEARLLNAQATYEQGDVSAAKALLDADRKDDPAQWAYKSLLAEFYREQGQEMSAQELDTEVARNMPPTSEAYYFLSMATLDRTQAYRYAIRATKLDPGYPHALERLLYLRLAEHDLEGAVARGASLVHSAQNDPYARLIYGHVLTADLQFQEAIKQYEHAIGMRPGGDTELWAYRYRGQARRCTGDYAGALKDLRAATTIERKRAGRTGGWLLAQSVTPLWILGEIDEARKVCRKIHDKLGPTLTDARWFLILREQGLREEAEDVLNHARETTKEAWLRQILDCLDGRLTSAVLVDAADSAQQRCEAYYYAGESCRLKYQHAEALRWFQRCVDTRLLLDPDTWPRDPMNEYELARWRLKKLLSDSVTETQGEPE